MGFKDGSEVPLGISKNKANKIINQMLFEKRIFSLLPLSFIFLQLSLSVFHVLKINIKKIQVFYAILERDTLMNGCEEIFLLPRMHDTR